MTYKDAWETIQFKHCEDTCDFGHMENCQGDKCEYYMALKALNAQYYAEQTEPQSDDIVVRSNLYPFRERRD